MDFLSQLERGIVRWDERVRYSGCQSLVARKLETLQTSHLRRQLSRAAERLLEPLLRIRGQFSLGR